MNVVRIAIAGTRSRIRSIIRRYDFASPPRRIADRIGRATCWSGMST